MKNEVNLRKNRTLNLINPLGHVIICDVKCDLIVHEAAEHDESVVDATLNFKNGIERNIFGKYSVKHVFWGQYSTAYRVL